MQARVMGDKKSPAVCFVVSNFQIHFEKLIDEVELLLYFVVVISVIFGFSIDSCAAHNYNSGSKLSILSQ
jgi:hypothetical protein